MRRIADSSNHPNPYAKNYHYRDSDGAIYFAKVGLKAREADPIAGFLGGNIGGSRMSPGLAHADGA